MWKRVPCRFAKLLDQSPNSGAPMVQRFHQSMQSALVVTRILMAIRISHSLAIRWNSALGGSLDAVTNLGVCASPFGNSEGMPLARFPSLERISPSGSKIYGRAVLRRRAQK